MFSPNREELRKLYYDAYQKALNKEVLTPLEAQIVDILQLHPEYQSHFETDAILDKDFSIEAGDVNPFLHMGLHLGLREQLGTNRPEGIRDIFQKLLKTSGEPHDVEHQMMDILAEEIWQAQRNGGAPDDTRYLAALKKLLN